MNYDNTKAGRTRIQQRREKTKEILQVCRDVCERHKGLVMIDDRYRVVDTKYYTISPKEISDV